MLEKDFNELDNDFITIWSKLFRKQDNDLSYSDNTHLEYLAEMGQVNALQCWYLKHRVGENKNIDLVAKYYEKNKDGFNTDLIKAHKDQIFMDLKGTISEAHGDAIRYIRRKGGVSYDVPDYYIVTHKLFNNAFSNELLKIKYYSEDVKSIERALALYKKGDALAGERMVEMMSGLEGVWPIDKQKKLIRSKIKTYATQIRKLLLVEFMKCNWNVDDLIASNPAVAYALGKNLSSKGLFLPTSPSKRKLGYEIIDKLSSRKISQTLLDYEEERENEKEELEKQKRKKFLEDFFSDESIDEKMKRVSREMDGISIYDMVYEDKPGSGNIAHALKEDDERAEVDRKWEEVDEKLLKITNTWNDEDFEIKI